MSRSCSAKGLTLIEVVVVLAILAVLAGVAVRSLEPIADQTRYEVTQKTLETVRDAIVEDRRLSSGTRQLSGFVSDIGRLPETSSMLIDDVGTTEFTGVTPSVPLSSFQFADRTGPAASNPPLNPTDVDCSGVSLRCGWRGPYVTVADPASGVVDGWGRPISLGVFPSLGSEVHLLWTAVTTQYTDQSTNVERLGLQTVSGVIQDAVGTAKNAEVALVYPDPTRSTSMLSVMEDADGSDTDNRFRFEGVPVGTRALVFKESGGTAQAIRYIEVTPMQQATLVFTVTEF